MLHGEGRFPTSTGSLLQLGFVSPGRVLRYREEQLAFGGKDEQRNKEAQTGPQGIPALPVLSRYAAVHCRMGTGTIW